MNTPDPRLDSLFDKVRSQPELMSVESVHTLLKASTPVTPSFNYKTMTFLTTTLISATAAIYWYATADHNKPKLPSQPQPVAATTTPVQAPQFAPITQPVLPAPISVIPDVPQYFHAIPAGEKEQSNPYIRLTDEQLLKLGIVYKEGVLVYKVEKSCLGNFSLYMSATDTKISRDGEDKNPDNPIALFITDDKGIILERLQKTKEKQFAEKAVSLLPLMVDDGNGKRYVLWYENESLFTGLLPADVLQNLQSNPLFYSHALPVQPVVRDRGDAGVVLNPLDTVSVPSYYPGQYIVADEHLMQLLGVIKESNGFEFKRNFNGKLLELKAFDDNFLFNQNGEFKVADKKPSKAKEIMPSFITGPRFSMKRNVLCFEDMFHNADLSVNQFFLNNSHKYIAVKMPVNTLQNIFWYRPSPALLNLLPGADKKRLQDFLMNPPQRRMDISATTPPQPVYLKVFNKEQPAVIQGVRTLSLTPEQLQHLRISVTEGHSIKFLSHNENHNFTPFIIDKNGIIFTAGDDKTQEIFRDITDKTLDTINPQLITDDLGKMARLSYGENLENLLSVTAKLIPVLVRSGADYTAIDKLQQHWRPDLIFWYEPTEQFLSLLNQVTAGEIRNDLAVINAREVQNSEDIKPGKSDVADTVHVSQNCKYFEVCRNVKGVIGDHNIYPNPAQNSTTVTFRLSAAAQVTVSVTDINGKLLLKTMHSAQADMDNAVNIPLSGMEAGMYLVYIESDKGDYLYERLIVTK